jgi:trimeric autotransporter adhesin
MLRYFLGSCLLTSLISIDGQSQCHSSCETNPSPARLSTRHIEAKGVGYHCGYTTVEGFFSFYLPWNDQWIPFVDLRGHVFNNNRLAANAGIGCRYRGVSRIWGSNFYYDYRHTHHHSYYQAALGLESLGEQWDVRLNCYLPMGIRKSHHYDLSFDHFVDHEMIQSHKREFSMSGANAEVGAHVEMCNIPFYFTMGPYYLTGSKTAWGGQAKAIVDCCEYVRIEGNVSYDNIFKWIGQGQLSVILPLGRKREIKNNCNLTCSSAVALSHRAIQRVERNEIIPVSSKRTKSVAMNPDTGLPYYFNFVNNQSHSKGTFESPYPDLTQAEADSKPYDVIYVFEGDGTPYTTGLTMQNFQHLWGSGITQQLKTNWGLVFVPPLTSGYPTITSSLSEIITLADGCEIAGIQCINQSGNTDFTTGISGVNITDTWIHHNRLDFDLGNNEYLNDIVAISVADMGQGNYDVSNNSVTITAGINGTVSSSILGIYAYSHSDIDTSSWTINQNNVTFLNDGTVSSSDANAYVYGIFARSGANTDSSNWQINQNDLIMTNNNSIQGGILGRGYLYGIYFSSTFNDENNLNQTFNQNKLTILNNGTSDFIFGIQSISIASPFSSGNNNSIWAITENNLAIINNGSNGLLEGIGITSASEIQNNSILEISNNIFTISNNGTNAKIEGIDGLASATNGDDLSIWKINRNIFTITNNSALNEFLFGISVNTSDHNNQSDWTIAQNLLTMTNTGDISANSIDSGFYGIYAYSSANNEVSSTWKINLNNLFLTNSGTIIGDPNSFWDATFCGIYTKDVGGSDHSQWQIDQNDLTMVHSGTIQGGLEDGSGYLFGIQTKTRANNDASNWQMNQNNLTIFCNGDIAGGGSGSGYLYGINVDSYPNLSNNSSSEINQNQAILHLTTSPNTIRGVYFTGASTVSSTLQLFLYNNFSYPYEIEIHNGHSSTQILDIHQSGNNPLPQITP